jgi:hypothetical protein
MRRHYFPLKAAVHAGVTQMPPSEICVASSWETAYAVRDVEACRRKVYFVRDYEPSFYPASAAQPPEPRRPRARRDLYCIFPARVLFLAPSANITTQVTRRGSPVRASSPLPLSVHWRAAPPPSRPPPTSKEAILR